MRSNRRPLSALMSELPIRERLKLTRLPVELVLGRFPAEERTHNAVTGTVAGPGVRGVKGRLTLIGTKAALTLMGQLRLRESLLGSAS